MSEEEVIGRKRGKKRMCRLCLIGRHLRCMGNCSCCCKKELDALHSKYPNLRVVECEDPVGYMHEPLMTHEMAVATMRTVYAELEKQEEAEEIRTRLLALRKEVPSLGGPRGEVPTNGHSAIPYIRRANEHS